MGKGAFRMIDIREDMRDLIKEMTRMMLIFEKRLKRIIEEQEKN